MGTDYDKEPINQLEEQAELIEKLERESRSLDKKYSELLSENERLREERIALEKRAAEIEAEIEKKANEKRKIIDKYIYGRYRNEDNSNEASLCKLRRYRRRTI